MGNSSSTPAAVSSTASSDTTTATTTTSSSKSSSPFSPVVPSGASNFYKKYPQRNIPEEFKPTAAVVGAGIAGIHCAWELSRLGFKVTVYDQFRSAGEGATKYDSGLIVNPRTMMHPEMARRILIKNDSSVEESKNDSAENILLQGSSSSSNNNNIGKNNSKNNSESGMTFYSSEKYFTYQPLVWRFNATRAYFKSLLPILFSGTTPVVSAETPMGGIFRESWRTWSQFRRKIKPNEKTLITHATELQESTSDIIDEIIKTDPEKFRKLIIAEPAVDSTNNNNSNNNSSTWKVIDSSKWCKTMAEILEQEYGVQFRYSNIVNRLQWRVDDETEYVSSVVNTDMTNKKVLASAADLIVIAAGSMSILQRDNKAREGYRLPLLSAAGFGLDIPLSMLGESAKAVLLRNASKGSLDSLMPYQLSDSQFLKVMQTPPSAPVPLKKVGQVLKDDGNAAPVWERVEPREPRIRISGLFSLTGDDIKRNVQPAPSACLEVISPRVNKSNENAANQEQATLLKAASEALQRMSQEFDIDDAQSGVSGFRFARGYTSDGLPLISKLGNAKNAFVVCGFGDDATLLAPGSAAYLADMIMKKRPVGVEAGNPFSLDRFYKYDYLMKYDDNFDTFQEKWYKGERWMENFGQPILTLLWRDFWSKGPGQWLTGGEKKDADYGFSKYQ